MRSYTLPSFLALLCLGASLHADVVPAALFTNHAVLQRNKPIPVWGTADAGEKVSVTFAGQTVSTTADAKGKWRVDLAPVPATKSGSQLVIKGNNTITLSDVVVGEVWLASGQSNMAWTVEKTYDTTIDVAASANFPLIRHISIERTIAHAPANSVKISRGAWQVAGPNTTAGFSAVGYYFAKDIHTVTGVPVGIINSSWGGTPVESWTSPNALSSNPDFAPVAQRWERVVANYPKAVENYNVDLAEWRKERNDANARGVAFTKPEPRRPSPPDKNPHKPSVLYNGMIHPLLPYALRGAIWYQGESNAGRASEYRALFSAMISDWRARFGQGDFSFYWVQLANYKAKIPDGIEWAFLREAQTQTLSLPKTGQAVIIDIGDVRDIHPRNKKDVGRRLARLALKRDYGVNVVDSGPVFSKAVREGAGFRIRFTNTDGGLIAPLNELGGFELAGEDKVFKPASAEIEKNTVVVTSPDVAAPVAVRYAWRNAPAAGLFNLEGLPAVPFRTDTW